MQRCKATSCRALAFTWGVEDARPSAKVGQLLLAVFRLANHGRKLLLLRCVFKVNSVPVGAWLRADIGQLRVVVLHDRPSFILWWTEDTGFRPGFCLNGDIVHRQSSELGRERGGCGGACLLPVMLQYISWGLMGPLPSTSMK